jgi:hypothetical protein
MKFTDGFKKLDADFRKKGIPTDKPGFCDHANFLKEESINSDFLNNYAAYVATQPYSDEYLQHAKNVITKASTILHKHLEINGRLGACVDISAVLSRILDSEGIWNCGIKGSLTISFPKDSGEENTYFWSVDHGNFTAGHAWLFAPPFSIVDATVNLQSYTGKKRDYIPGIILAKESQPVAVEMEDIVSPEARIHLSHHGVPKDLYLEASAPQLNDILKVFPAFNVSGIGDTVMKYSPVAIHASETPFEEMDNMKFSGKTPFELYESFFKGKLI